MESASRKETIFVAYEIAHVAEAVAFARNNPDAKIISLNAWAERDIRDQGIEVISLTRYHESFQDERALLQVTVSIGREWYRVPGMKFFEYRGVRIGEAFESAIGWYLERVLYHVKVFEAIAEAHPHITRVVLPYSGIIVPDTARVLAAYEANVVVDAATLVAKRHGFEVTATGQVSVRGVAQATSRSLRYRAQRFALKAINYAVRLTTRKKPVRVFASDYWRNIGPIIKSMNDVELVLMDRREFAIIPWRDIFVHRIRSIHPQDVLDARIQCIVDDHMAIVRAGWREVRESVRRLVADISGSNDLWDLLGPALDFLVEGFTGRVIGDTEAVFAILERERITRVLLRASVSSQHHFSIVEQVANVLKISSIELQHGMEVSNPISPRSHLYCDYLAAYGAGVGDPFVRNYGYSRERIIGVGSPRFDHYGKAVESPEARAKLLMELGLDPGRPVVSCAVQMECVDLSPYTFSSYDLVTYFAKMRALRDRVPTLQFIFKVKPRGIIPAYRRHVSDLFPDGGVALIDDRSILSIFGASDFVMCGDTTLVYEAMIIGRPLVLYPLKPSDEAFILTHREDGIVPDSDDDCASIVEQLANDSAFRAQVAARQQEALHTRYSFDGHASERVAELLRSPLKVFSREAL